MSIKLSTKVKMANISTLIDFDGGVAKMINVVDKRSAILAPKDKGHLVNSRKITRVKSAEYRLAYGGGKVGYARLRHFENRKNPQTKYYLKRAFDGVVEGDVGRYFKIKGGIG